MRNLLSMLFLKKLNVKPDKLIHIDENQRFIRTNITYKEAQALIEEKMNEIAQVKVIQLLQIINV